jgi:CRISPR-associated endoribonuclease Cas6
MRIKLKLNVQEDDNLLPLNYQYPLSAWIYKIINKADQDYARWLHEEGHKIENKKFKLFTFSQMFLEKYRISGDRLLIESDSSELYISFYAEKTLENFIIGLFQDQQLQIRDRKSRAAFSVELVESLPEPSFSDYMTFRCLSPLCLSKTVKKHGKKSPFYLPPDHEDFDSCFMNNLVFKYFSVHPKDQAMKKVISSTHYDGITYLGKPKSRLITVKADTKEETRVRGYLFDFKLHAPAELIRLGYEAGFGEKNSIGFGCVESKM